MKIKHMTTDAMLAAMCMVLAMFALNFGSVKITFESLPVHVGALLFGPVHGMLIGGIGTLLYQLLDYGVTVTTVLWIIPYAACGLLVGGYAQKKSFSLSGRETVLLTAAGELMITALNTFALYVDSHIFGYYTPTFITGVLGFRLTLCLAKGIVYGLVLPAILHPARQTLHL